MITDLDGGDPAPGHRRAKRAVSIALVLAAVVGYGALTWPAPSGSAPAAIPEVPAARASTSSLFGPLDPRYSGEVVFFSCAGAPGGVNLTDIFVMRPAIPPPGQPPPASPAGQVWVRVVSAGSAGDSLELERCGPGRSPARDLFVP